MLAFSSEWVAAYKDAINNNEEYAKSAANWTLGKIALVMKDSDQAVLLDLYEGKCQEASSTDTPIAEDEATFVILGDADTWQDVLGGKLQPLMGIMRGKLKLIKGSIAKLMPYAHASVALVKSAQDIPTEFPE